MWPLGIMWHTSMLDQVTINIELKFSSIIKFPD